ncbi:hypothetical protein XELAEV_18008151mg [Xenopus laevis]|uniref:Uncharacterized protein n=1 Tax=Xenopus laevis TaxID=8355 RepID=A0A974E442_XENLA|nr:hypothetical protein XELAEV_18008151mg [Xenopus laevis]
MTAHLLSTAAVVVMQSLPRLCKFIPFIKGTSLRFRLGWWDILTHSSPAMNKSAMHACEVGGVWTSGGSPGCPWCCSKLLLALTGFSPATMFG